MKKGALRFVLLVYLAAAGCDSGKPEPLPTSGATAPASGQVDAVAPADGGAEDLAENVRRVQDDVRSCVNAIYAGDVDTVLQFTHPKVIEMLGGEANARQAMRAAFAKLKETGMSLESLEFPEQPTFLKGDQHEFVIVPTKSIVSAGGRRLESLNYQVGARETGR